MSNAGAGLILNILIDGVPYAMILFMITVGLSLTMGLMRVVNLAHGAFAMFGGFLVSAFMQRWAVSFWLAAIGAVIAVALAAWPIERLLVRRFYRRPELDQMLVTIGLMFVAIAIANMLFGSAVTGLQLPEILSGVVRLGERSVTTHRLAVSLLGLIVLIALWVSIDRSAFGIKVRAAVDNSAMAQAVGINTPRVYAQAFAIGAALAALGGIAGAELLPMEPGYASKYLVTFLAVVAVGGHGNLFGSFWAALLLGLVDTTMKYLVPQLSSVAFFATMFVVLLFRPNGLFGKSA